MMKKILHIAVWFVLLPMYVVPLYAQYTDHRNRGVDSLEQVLAFNSPAVADLPRIYRDLAWGYQGSNVEKSMQYAQKCAETAIPLDKWRIAADGYWILGTGFYKISQYDSAMVCYNKVLEAVERMKGFPEKYTELNIDDDLSAIYGSIGSLYNIQGMYHEAMEYYTGALKLLEKHGWKESQAVVYNNIGEMYMSMANYERAEINFTKLDSLAHIMADSLLIAYSKRQFAGLYLTQKEYDKSLQNAEIAYSYFFSHAEEGENKAVILNYLSEIHLEGHGNDRQAEEYARQALTLLEVLDIPREKSISLRLLSSIHLKRGEWHKAGQTALEALAADDTEPANTMALYEILSKAYSKLGNSDKTWEYFDKHNELQSSWSNKHYQSAIRDMEMKYETEKKETRIATLEDEKRLMIWLSIAGGAGLLLALAAFFFLWRWTVQKKRLSEQQVKQLEQEKQLVATQAILDGEVQERTRLARDLHDGLGSMLTGAKLGFIEMKQNAKLKDADAERFDKALELLDLSANEMRRVAHHLMPDSLSRFGLKPAVADFCSNLSSVEFVYYGDGSRLEPNLEVMIYRCIYELVNNALKHAHASQIIVQIMQRPDSIAFTVQDDGCGFDPSAVSKGMGLANIRTRIASYNGILNIDSKAGEGTEINVELRVES